MSGDGSSQESSLHPSLRAIFNAPSANPTTLFSELAPVLQHRLLHSVDSRRYLVHNAQSDPTAKTVSSILSALGKAPKRFLLPSSRTSAPSTSLDYAILEQVDELLKLPVPSTPARHYTSNVLALEAGPSAQPQLVPLYAGFKATTPSAGKNRIARRQRRAALGEEHLGIAHSGLGLRAKGDHARGLLISEETLASADLEASDEEDDGFEIVGRRSKSGPPSAYGDTPSRKGKRRNRRSMADLGYGNSPAKAKTGAPNAIGREELLGEVGDIETDMQNLVVRRKLIAEEIDDVDQRIARLAQIRQDLRKNMLGLVEEELELQDELQGVQEQLLTLDAQPLSANSGTSAFNTGASTLQTSRRRKGPAFLPAEHDDLPPQIAFQTLPGHRGAITALDFSEPYGTLVSASGDDDSSVRLWDLAHGEEIGRLEGHEGTVKCLQVESALCITGGVDGRVKIWNLELACALAEDQLDAIAGGQNAPQVGRSSSFTSSRGTSVHTALETVLEGADDDTVAGAAATIVDESPQTPCLRTLDAHTKAVTCLYFDGTCLVTGSSDKTLKQWDLNTGQCVITMDILWAISNPAATQSLSASPPSTPHANASRMSNSNAAVSPSPARRPTLGGSLKRLSSANYLLSDQYNEFDPWTETFSVPTPAYSDGSWDMYSDFVGGVQFWGYALASGSADGCVRMWDMRTGQTHRNLVGHIAPVTCLQFDEHYLVSGSLDRSIRVWDLRTGAIADTIRFEGPITAVQFDSRKIIAAAGENGLKVYNRTTLQLDTLSINGHTSPAERLRFMDRYMVTGAKDHTVKIWNLG